MAKTLFEILRKQTEIANRLEAATRKVIPEIPIMQFPEIPRWNPEIPLMSLPIAQMPIYKPAFRAEHIRARAAEAPKPKRIKPTKPNPYAGQYFKLQEFKIITRYKNLKICILISEIQPPIAHSSA